MTITPLRRFGLIAVLLIFGQSTATAGSFAPAPNEFRDAGGALVCITPHGPGDVPGPGYRACLRIGPVQIGQSLREIAMIFGDPHRVIENGDTTQRVYIIDIGTPQGQPVPYWVIGFDKDRRVFSIQMTGERGDKKLAFSSIRLGDPASRVIKILGKPYVTGEVKDVEGAEFWGYMPFPISIEIKNKRVYSIRISESADR